MYLYGSVPNDLFSNKVSLESVSEAFKGIDDMAKETICQVRVYSGRGSSQVRTKADEGEGQRAGQGISPAGVETDWIQ